MNPAMFEAAGITGASLVQLAADVESVEGELYKVVQSPIRTVQGSLEHTLSAGGKRLRPAFLILAARACNPDFSLARAIKLGACMEMIHMATLIHDDVIDEAKTRRGRPTAAILFGNTTGILSGDVLLAKAMQILAEDGDLRIIRLAAKMVVEMAEGEAREVEVRGQFDLTEADHLEILRMKTAAFVECCCQIGAMVADAPDKVIEGMGHYGHHLGIGFQIVDDLLDYRGKTSETGKPKATDFKEGCATLPLIELSKRASDKEVEWLRQHFGSTTSDADLALVVAWIEQYEAYKRPEEMAREHLEKATEALKVLPASANRELLEAAGKFVVQRSS